MLLQENEPLLRIRLDTRPLANGNAARGVGRYTQLLATHLQQQPNVAVYTDTDPARLDRRKKSQRASIGVDVHHYPFFDLFFRTLPASLPASTVITIHDLIPLHFWSAYRPGLRGRFNWWWQRQQARRARALITDSQASKDSIVRFLGVPADRVHVVYLAADPQIQQIGAAERRRLIHKYHLPSTYLLYVGDINYNKNLPQLIKSLKFLPEEVALVCVGKAFVPQSIPEWRAIEQQVAMSDVSRRIHFITDVDDNAVLSSIYSAASVYVQPSLYEGFGLPVLEAMQCRTPVVAARNSSLIEVGGDSAVFVDTLAESIAEGVTEVLGWSQTRRTARVQAAFQWSQQFSWERTARQTVALYRQIAS